MRQATSDGETWRGLVVRASRSGRRPFLILTRDEALPVLHQVLAVPATRNVREIPTEVVLGHADGMPAACCLTLDDLTVIRPALCVERITRLFAARMREVCAALALVTACGDRQGRARLN